jgi:hypothetical protein
LRLEPSVMGLHPNMGDATNIAVRESIDCRLQLACVMADAMEAHRP